MLADCSLCSGGDYCNTGGGGRGGRWRWLLLALLYNGETEAREVRCLPRPKGLLTIQWESPLPQALGQHPADKAHAGDEGHNPTALRTDPAAQKSWHLFLKTLSARFVSEHKLKQSTSGLKSRLGSRPWGRVCSHHTGNFLNKHTKNGKGNQREY